LLWSIKKIDGGTTLEFTLTEAEPLMVMMNNEATKWNIFGEGSDRPREGESLMHAKSFISYWTAGAAFYPDAVIAEL